MRLSAAQIRQLRRIAEYVPSENWPYAGYFDTITERSLVRRGLIERVTHVSPLDGNSSMARIHVTWHMCRLTEAGRAAIRD